MQNFKTYCVPVMAGNQLQKMAALRK